MKDTFNFNCRDFSAMTLSVIRPSKLEEGLQMLESINYWPLQIRYVIENRATLVSIIIFSMIGAFGSSFLLVHGEYKKNCSIHFSQKMENRDIDFMIDNSLPGITCFHDSGEFLLYFLLLLYF